MRCSSYVTFPAPPNDFNTISNPITTLLSTSETPQTNRASAGTQRGGRREASASPFPKTGPICGGLARGLEGLEPWGVMVSLLFKESEIKLLFYKNKPCFHRWKNKTATDQL